MSELISTGVTFGAGRQAINYAFSGEAQFNILTASTYYSGATPLGEVLNSSIVKFHEVTYEQLMTLINSSGLTTGDYYSVTNFQTIHKIPYTTDINTGSTETLMTQALSQYEVDHNVRSVQYPMDTIYWDPADDKILPYVETRVTASTDYYTSIGTTTRWNYPEYTGSSNFSVVSLGGRPGRIYYRKDNLRKLETAYDFRSVKFRRWQLAEPYVVTSAVVEWDGALSVDSADILSGTSGADQFFLAKTNYSTDSSEQVIQNPIFNYNLTDFFDHLRDLGWNSGLSVFGNKTGSASGYTSPTPDNMVVIENTSFGNMELTLSATSNYIDVTTFDNQIDVQTNLSGNSFDDPGIIAWGTDIDRMYNFNISLVPAVGAYLEQIDWEYYPNITFFGLCNNIEIGTMTSDVSVYSTANLKVGNHCHNMLIEGHDSTTYSINIGDFNRNVFLFGSYLPYSNLGTSLGNSNVNVLISKIPNSHIGSGNENVFVLDGSSKVSVGNFNNRVFFDDTDFVGIEHENYNVSFYTNGDSFIGSNNSNVFISGSGTKMGSNNSNIKPLRNSWSLVEGVISSSSNNNSIGNGCNNIHLVGLDNTYGDECNNLLCLNNTSYNYTNFDSGFSNVTFQSTAANSGSTYSFSYATFENISDIWTSGALQLKVNLDENSLSAYHFNLQDRSSIAPIYGLASQYLSAYTSTTTYQIDVHLITGTTA